MACLSKAKEAITDTIFHELVKNGLPENYDHFVLQESYYQQGHFQSWERGWRTTITQENLDVERGQGVVQ